MTAPRYDEEHLDRAQHAIALVTAFSGIRETGATKAAGLITALMEEDPHPEFLLAAVASLAAVLVHDLSKVTGAPPEQHLQALGRAAALLRNG
jgi:hypothetical protein